MTALQTKTSELSSLLYGYISKATSEAGYVNHEVFDFTAQVNQNVNVSTQQGCIHEYGGLVCGVRPPVHYATVEAVGDFTSTQVVRVLEDTTYPLVSTDSEPLLGNAVDSLDRYNNGKLKVVTGQLAGAEYYIRSIVSATPDQGFLVNLAKPHPGQSLKGQLVTISIGCAKSWEACKLNSGGLNRFWGFPFVVSSTKVFTAASSISRP